MLPASGAGGGRTATFDLGTLINTDRDNATPETLTFEYRASVINAAANVRGTMLLNAATLAWNDGTGNRSVTDAADAIRVVEPRMVLNKTVSPTTGDAGDTLTYQIVVTNPVAAPNGADRLRGVAERHDPCRPGLCAGLATDDGRHGAHHAR